MLTAAYDEDSQICWSRQEASALLQIRCVAHNGIAMLDFMRGHPLG
jgi:hypothetical protein